MIQGKERCNARVKEVDEIEAGSGKWKRRDSVSPFHVFYGVFVAVFTTDPLWSGSIHVA